MLMDFLLRTSNKHRGKVFCSGGTNGLSMAIGLQEWHGSMICYGNSCEAHNYVGLVKKVRTALVTLSFADIDIISKR